MCRDSYIGACGWVGLAASVSVVCVGSVVLRMSWHACGDGLAGPAMIGRVLCRVAYVGTCADFPMIVPNADL